MSPAYAAMKMTTYPIISRMSQHQKAYFWIFGPSLTGFFPGSVEPVSYPEKKKVQGKYERVNNGGKD
jgi:hypothetical protein